MRLSKAIPRLRFERRRLYAQSKVCPPEMRREYRERAEAIGAVLGLKLTEYRPNAKLIARTERF